MTEAKAKQETPKAPVASIDKPDMSDAQQKRLTEFYSTHVVPSGYSFNARDGLHKTEVKK